MAAVLKNCAECGKEFQATGSQAAKRKYCSRTCASRSGNRRHRVTPGQKVRKALWEKKRAGDRTPEERVAFSARTRENCRKRREVLKQDSERYREYRLRENLARKLKRERRTPEQREKESQRYRERHARRKAHPEYLEKRRLCGQKYYAKKRLAELNKTLTAMEANDGQSS